MNKTFNSHDEREISPVKLLSLAISKRCSKESKEKDYRKEILQQCFIQSLCKIVGQKARRRKRKNRRQYVQKCLYIDGTESECDDDRTVPDHQVLVEETNAIDVSGSSYCTNTNHDFSHEKTLHSQIGDPYVEPSLKRARCEFVDRARAPLQSKEPVDSIDLDKFLDELFNDSSEMPSIGSDGASPTNLRYSNHEYMFHSL